MFVGLFLLTLLLTGSKLILTTARLIWLITIFFLVNQHLSIILVMLELLGMIAIFRLTWQVTRGSLGLALVFVVITVGVVEAAVGLSLLSLLARRFSRDLMKFKF